MQSVNLEKAVALISYNDVNEVTLMASKYILDNEFYYKENDNQDIDPSAFKTPMVSKRYHRDFPEDVKDIIRTMLETININITYSEESILVEIEDDDDRSLQHPILPLAPNYSKFTDEFVTLIDKCYVANKFCTKHYNSNLISEFSRNQDCLDYLYGIYKVYKDGTVNMLLGDVLYKLSHLSKSNPTLHAAICKIDRKDIFSL